MLPAVRLPRKGAPSIRTIAKTASITSHCSRNMSLACAWASRTSASSMRIVERAAWGVRHQRVPTLPLPETAAARELVHRGDGARRFKVALNPPSVEQPSVANPAEASLATAQRSSWSQRAPV